MREGVLNYICPIFKTAGISGNKNNSIGANIDEKGVCGCVGIVWFEIPLSVHEPATYFTSCLCLVSLCRVGQGTCTECNRLYADDREAAASTLQSLITPRFGLVTKRERE